MIILTALELWLCRHKFHAILYGEWRTDYGIDGQIVAALSQTE
jgi:hypothetical protein